MLLGSDQALFWRRGWTHGIPALVVLPLLMTGLFVAWTRLVKRAPEGPPLRPATLLCLSTIAVASHPTLDWMNNYGMRWLMPIRGAMGPPSGVNTRDLRRQPRQRPAHEPRLWEAELRL